ncbi:Coenzyme F420 hydrogenase/dehydrogenase, beta subunit C-terminal domain [Pseudoscardovia suis]
MGSDRSAIEHVISSADADAIDGHSTYCVGCGACAFLDPAFSIAKNSDGCYCASINGTLREGGAIASSVCPFAAGVDENEIAKDLFSAQTGIQHDQYLGYYLKTYVGFVNEDGWRARGSSGGFVSWLAATLLREGLVDAVVHVKDGPDSEHMYQYAVSHTVEELATGAKSKYYPVEMSQVLTYMKEHDERYLFIGIPCFVKAMRLLCRNDKLLHSRVKYCIGLVCGHLKSDFFAKSEAWEAGVPLEDIRRVDFRYKIPDSPASDYAIKADRSDGGAPIIKRTNELSTTNWGLGYFKYNACDYCDDVLAETADVTFGDAWLPQYVSDSQGCNVVVVRNRTIQNILDKHAQELVLHDSTPEEIYQSQAGGFRHRRQGLAYRLDVHKKRGEWTPTKRVQPSLEGIGKRRQKIYAMRTVLKNESFVAFTEAEKANDFSAFIRHMRPVERKYYRIQTPFLRRLLRKVKRLLKGLLRRS